MTARVPAKDTRTAGFAGEIGFGSRPALLVVDMMKCYFERTSLMYAGVESVVQPCVRLARVSHAHGAPVFFTRQLYEEGGANDVYARKVRALELLRPGSTLADLHPDMPVHLGETFVKHYPSAFHKTGFADRLRALDVDTLLITGLTTSGCIRATAMDCLLHGLHGVVVREAVGDRDARIQQSNLFDINAKLADVKAEPEVTAWLERARAPSRE
jgi:maleamate amidohydrolase